MRTALLLIALATACTPDIVSGAYLCGPEQACPDDQACDGIDNVCVTRDEARPFECTESLPPQLQAQCVTIAAQHTGCIGGSGGTTDAVDFTVPAQCAMSSVNARLSFPLAFAPLQMTLVDAATGAMVATDGPCADDAADDGDVRRCLEADVSADGSYRISVAATGEDNCGGACDYNRYRLTYQLQALGAR